MRVEGTAFAHRRQIKEAAIPQKNTCNSVEAFAPKSFLHSIWGALAVFMCAITISAALGEPTGPKAVAAE